MEERDSDLDYDIICAPEEGPISKHAPTLACVGGRAIRRVGSRPAAPTKISPFAKRAPIDMGRICNIQRAHTGGGIANLGRRRALQRAIMGRFHRLFGVGVKIPSVRYFPISRRPGGGPGAVNARDAQ